MNHLINNLITVLNGLGSGFCDYAGRMFVQSGILIALLLFVDLLIRKHAKATLRYCIWMLVFVKLILPPSLSLPTGIGYWCGDVLSAGPPVLEQASTVVQIEPAGAPAPVDSTLSAEIPQIHSSQIDPESAAPAAPAFSDLEVLTWQAIVFVIWLMGAAVLSVLLIHRMLFVRRLIVLSEPVKTEILDKCRRQLGIKRDIKLRLSGKLQSPAVCGLFRPVILMPAGLLERLSPDKLRAVLIHELAHIKRCDLWINSAQTLLQIIYFYNPLVWLANALVRRIREQAVDEMVLVALGAEAKFYSNTLIDIAEMAFFKTSLSLRLIGVVESKKSLEGRIKHMLNRPIPKSAKLGIVGLIAIFITGAILLPMAKAKSRPPELVIKGTVAEAEKVPPVGDYALEFDGIDDFLEIHASESLQLGRHFTIQMWVKPEFPDLSIPDKERNLLSKGSYVLGHPDEKGNRQAGSYGFGFKLIPEGESKINFDVCRANKKGIFSADVVMPKPSNWLHLAVVFDGEKARIYRGVRFELSEETYKPAPNSNIIIGGKFLIPTGNPFKGQIAELRIWNRALSMDEIAKYKNMSLNGDEPNLVGCWTFEQAEGQRAIDISPYKNHARLGSTYGVDNADPAWVRINTEKENVKNPAVQIEWEETKAVEDAEVTDKREFKATLPNGVTVELVGVCEHPSESKQWWKPDGTLLKEAPYDKFVETSFQLENLFSEISENVQRIELALRITTPTEIPPRIGWRMESIGYMFLMKNISNKGHISPQLKALLAEVPSKDSTIEIKLTINGSWIKIKNISLRLGAETDVQIKVERPDVLRVPSDRYPTLGSAVDAAKDGDAIVLDPSVRDEDTQEGILASESNPQIAIDVRVFFMPQQKLLVSSFLHDELNISTVDSAAPLMKPVQLAEYQARKLEEWLSLVQGVKLIAVPRFNIIDGKLGDIRLTTNHEYISGYKDPNNASDERKPVVERLTIGTIVKITPKLQRDRETIVMNFELSDNQIVKLELMQDKAGHEFNIPIIGTQSVNTRIAVKNNRATIIPVAGGPGKTIILLIKAVVLDSLISTEKTDVQF